MEDLKQVPQHTLVRRPRRVSLVVAMDRGRVIGTQGRLPWHIPEDLKRFKALTMGHSIIMGRKTHASIGRLLPGRRSIIVTRQPGYVVDGAVIVHSLEEGLAACAGEDEAFVIGGGELYVQALRDADRIHLTEVDASTAGDTWFPALPADQWREVSRERGQADARPACDFVVLERTRGPRA
jgi:dihydrofolate reductase